MLVVNDLFKYAVENNLKLLSNFNAEWWDLYKSNHETFDRIFNRRYKTYKPWELDWYCSVLSQADFLWWVQSVEDCLMLHKPEIDKLYETITSQTLDLLNTTDYIEKMDRDTTESLGSRNDTSSNTYGQKTTTDTNKVSPYDSSAFNNNYEDTIVEGNQTNSGSFTTGAQSNGGTEDYTKTIQGYRDVDPTKHINDMLDFYTVHNFMIEIFNILERELLLV